MNAVPRPSSSLVAFWAVAGIAVLFVGDAVLSHDLRLALASRGPAALAVWAAWLLLYRPQIRFDGAGLLVVNPLRFIAVPWAHVTSVTQKFQILLELDDGSRITCWGSPFPEKPGLRRPPASSAAASERASSLPAASLESMRVNARPAGETEIVRRRWDVPAAVIGALLIVACLVELIILR